MIDPGRVNDLFKDCLFSSEEIINNIPIYEPIYAEGITMTVGFNSIKIEKNKEEIISIIDNLHPTFKEGWTFLNLCMDKKENIWTGNHSTMQELLCLGIAIDKIEILAPREMWDILPGGVPYIVTKE